MQQNNNTTQPKLRRGFFSLFTHQEVKRPLRDTKYLKEILDLQKENQNLRYENHFLKKGKDIKVESITPIIPLAEPTLNTAKKPTTLNTFDYLYLLEKGTLQYILGRGEHNNTIIQDVSKEPQLLIAGKTGSGKSVSLFNVLTCICYNNTPKTLKISLIDPKLLSFGDKRIIKSKFLNEAPSIGDENVALEILRDAFNGMMERYQLMLKKGVKDYRKIGLHAHVIFIDEVFELLEGSNGKDILNYITRIASLGRAGGVHLVMATQSPRAKTLSGVLKANLEFIGHRMSNPTESKLIELPLAHKLKGKGDGMKTIDGEIIRFQATFLDIDLDETYQYFNPSATQNRPKTDTTPTQPKTDPKQTQNTEPKTDPKQRRKGAYRAKNKND